jgi:CRP/FNR family cyclic AMP-dependent transcriptional regulator
VDNAVNNAAFKEAVECVACVMLFAELNRAQVQQVAGLLETMRLPAGEVLTVEGEPASDFYILVEGEVSIGKKLRLPALETVETEDRILTRINAETTPVLGETALVGGGLRLATVRCVTDCRFYCISATRLDELMKSDTTIGAAVYRRLCEMLYDRLESANTDVVKLSAALVFALED